MHPPGNPPHPKNVSPRKRSPVPLSAKSNADILRTVYPARNPPDSVISRAGPLMPEEGLLPPRCILYHRSGGESNEKPGTEEGKTSRDGFFSRWSNLLVKFRGGSSPFFRNAPPSTHSREETRIFWNNEKKNRIRGGPRMRRESRCHPHKMCGWKPQTRLISA